MTIISNTSPLLYLAKLGKLGLLKSLFRKIVIAEEVYREVVVRGKQQGFIDALAVEQAINDKWVEVKKVSYLEARVRHTSELDAGELETIQLAQELKASMVLIDDAPARIIAESLNLVVKGTLYVIIETYKKKLMNKAETKDLLSQLISLGFRLSAEIYAKVLDEIDNTG